MASNPPAQEKPKSGAVGKVNFDSSVFEKVESLKLKTEEARRLFNLPETETLIQDYRCTARPSPIHGRMFITSNYIGFVNFLGNYVDVIPFRRISNITQEVIIFFNTGIDIVMDDGSRHSFGGFVHRDETFYILNHLWKHPPSFVVLENVNTEQNSESKSNGESAAKASSGGGGGGGGGGFTTQKRNGVGGSSSGNNGGWDSEFESSGGGGFNDNIQSSKGVQVDLETSKRALALAQETRLIGVNTLEELASQAETIDRIEQEVEHIHTNLDRGDRYIRAMDSNMGVIKNVFSLEKRGNLGSIQNRTITIQRQDKGVEFEILLKNADDSLTPCVLKLGEEVFACFNKATEKIEPNCSWRYEMITHLVMRARTLHMDIRFGGQVPRFRLMSSFIQGITNEIILRSVSKQVAVVFEPNVKKFAFGSFNISKNSGGSKQSQTTDSSGMYVDQGGFRTGSRNNGPTASSLLSQNATQETRQAVDQQERDLLAINDILGDLGSIAGAMGSELDRQNEQIDRINTRSNEAQIRMVQSTYKAKNLL